MFTEGVVKLSDLPALTEGGETRRNPLALRFDSNEVEELGFFRSILSTSTAKF